MIQQTKDLHLKLNIQCPNENILKLNYLLLQRDVPAHGLPSPLLRCQLYLPPSQVAGRNVANLASTLYP